MQWRKMGWKTEGICKEIINFKKFITIWVKEKEKNKEWSTLRNGESVMESMDSAQT